MEDFAKIFALALWIVVAALNIFPGYFDTNLEAFYRYYPQDAPKGDFDYQKVSVRINTGYDHLWAYGVVISPTQKQAQVYYSLYDLNPFGNISELTYWRRDPYWGEKYAGGDLVWAQAPDGEWIPYYDCRFGPGDSKYARGRVGYIPVEEGQDHIDLRYERLGETVEFQVPIDKEVWE